MQSSLQPPAAEVTDSMPSTVDGGHFRQNCRARVSVSCSMHGWGANLSMVHCFWDSHVSQMPSSGTKR
eukprot:2368837-Rhodomonas_salina.2